MRIQTDEDYNLPSRCVLVKLEIFLDGTEASPLVVTRENYLIDCDILEEASAESKNPLGAISSNELTFSLFNKAGMFNPANDLSIYYGKIKTGIVVKPFFKTDTVDTAWVQMGVFYVSDWDATVTGTSATVTATDRLQQVFLEPTPSIPVQGGVTFKELLTEVFTKMGYNVVVHPSLNKILQYAFIEGKPQAFLQEIIEGAMAYCHCDKTGNIVVNPLRLNTGTRAILRDSDQVLKVDIAQSILKTYNGVELQYSLPQISEHQPLLLLKDMTIPPGIFTHSTVAFTNGPVEQITSLSAVTDNKEVMVKDYESTPWDIKMVTHNFTSGQAVSDLVVYGYYIIFVEAALTDSVTNALKAGSRYIQNQAYATEYKSILNAFITNDIPLLNVTIRGNPLLSIGDKIQVISEKYNLNFIGILQRANYKYVGSLSCEITLLNAEIIEGVM